MSTIISGQIPVKLSKTKQVNKEPPPQQECGILLSLSLSLYMHKHMFLCECPALQHFSLFGGDYILVKVIKFRNGYNLRTGRRFSVSISVVNNPFIHHQCCGNTQRMKDCCWQAAPLLLPSFDNLNSFICDDSIFPGYI